MRLSSDAQLAKELSDREMREHRELTQERLAEMLGTSQNAISRL